MSRPIFGKTYINFDINSVERNIESIKNDLILRKVLIFKNANIAAPDVIELLKKVHSNHNYLMIDAGRSSEPLFDFFESNQKPLPSSKEYFSRWGVDRWHVDDSWEEYVVDISCMHMRTPSPEGGNTRFVDLERAYDCLKKEDIDFIYKIKSPGWNADINEVPMYRKPEHMHPSIRVHPATKNISIFYNGQNTVAKDNDKWVAYKLNLLDIFDMPDNHIEVSWAENDLAIWDNRCVAHSVLGGFSRNQRIYDKIEIGKSEVETVAA